MWVKGGLAIASLSCFASSKFAVSNLEYESLDSAPAADTERGATTDVSNKVEVVEIVIECWAPSTIFIPFPATRAFEAPLLMGFMWVKGGLAIASLSCFASSKCSVSNLESESLDSAPAADTERGATTDVSNKVEVVEIFN